MPPKPGESMEMEESDERVRLAIEWEERRRLAEYADRAPYREAVSALRKLGRSDRYKALEEANEGS